MRHTWLTTSRCTSVLQGADDKDWDVYVTMAGQNEQLEEEEEDEAALKEMDELLQQHDADNLRADAEAQKQAIYQLHIAYVVVVVVG